MAHGNSHEEALSNVRGAMMFWIDVDREQGEPDPAPKDRRHMYA